MNKLATSIIISVLLLMLLPFFALHFFTWPAADDFFLLYKSGDSVSPVFNNFLELYQSWGGRYSTFLFALPQNFLVNNIILYRIATFLVLILFSLALYGFFRAILAQSITADKAIIFSLSLLLLYLNTIPGAADTIYWLSGVIVYTLPLIFFLTLSMLLLKKPLTQKAKLLNNSCIAITAFLLAGFNELSMLLAIFLAGVHFMKSGKLQGSQRWALLTAVVAGSAIFVFSPGNTERLMFFPDSQNIFSMLRIAATSLLKLNGIFLKSIPVLLTAFLVFQWLNPQSFNDKLKNILKTHPLTVVLAGQLFLFLLLCLPAWAMGINPPLRIYNFLSLLWLIWFLLLLATTYNFLRKKNIKTNLPLNGRSIIILVFITIVSVMGNFHKVPGEQYVFGSNTSRAWYDLCFNAIKYNESMKERRLLLDKALETEKAIIEVPIPANIPETIFFLDITNDHTHWINKLHAHYYGIEYIKSYQVDDSDF